MIAKSAENGNLIVPQDLQCTYTVSANSVVTDTLVHDGVPLTTLLAEREEAFDATTPLQKVLSGDGSRSLRINPSADVVANAFKVGAFRLHSPDIGGAEIQYFDAGWQRVCIFSGMLVIPACSSTPLRPLDPIE